MEVKEIWTSDDFEVMGWHDSRLYQMKFPNEDYNFVLYIDYIFKWEKQQDDSFKFWVSPCELKFLNISDLKLNLSFDNFSEIFVSEIKKQEIGLTPNEKMIEWKYIIETDRGNIEFLSTGYIMKVISEPILSESQDMST